VIYTGSLKKQEEHGGFAQDDTNVMLLVSNLSIHEATVRSLVETSQVAPTVLKLLGLDPKRLDAVRKEGTPVLPGFLMILLVRPSVRGIMPRPAYRAVHIL
jgi:hypothetical protein